MAGRTVEVTFTDESKRVVDLSPHLWGSGVRRHRTQWRRFPASIRGWPAGHHRLAQRRRSRSRRSVRGRGADRRPARGQPT